MSLINVHTINGEPAPSFRECTVVGWDDSYTPQFGLGRLLQVVGFTDSVFASGGLGAITPGTVGPTKQLYSPQHDSVFYSVRNDDEFDED